MRTPNHQSHYGFFIVVLSLGLLLFTSLTLLFIYTAPAIRQSNHASSVPRVPNTLETLGEKLPLHFEPNRGQLPAGALYRSRGPGYNLLLTTHQAVLMLDAPGRAPAKNLPIQEALSLALVHGDPAVRLVPEKALPGKANYLLGNRPEQWRTDIPLYGKVRYAGVYPGIDLVYYGNQRRLEYDFVVSPGSDPGRIELALGGAKAIALDEQGNLRVDLNSGQLQFQRPEIYQLTDAGKKSIRGRFLLRGNQRIAFEVEDYDTTRPLVIDPVLSYSSFLGSAGTDGGHGIAVDTAGNMYVTGMAGGSDFPLANSYSNTIWSFDAFVTKLNPAGNALVYSTFLGGTSSDSGYAIAVDTQGSAYVAGRTSSSNFPVANPLQATYGGGSSDAFVTKLSPAGNSLVYSTYLGGSGSEGWVMLADAGEMGLALHPAGYAFVTGQTTSSNFPTANAFRSTLAGAIDVFVAKVSPPGNQLVYSTYLGGSSDDYGRGIAVDVSGRACVTGQTTSGDFPVANPFQGALAGETDAFVTCLNPAGTGLMYSTYLGGSNVDAGFGIALDNSGNAYVTGQVRSTNFPIVAPLQSSLSGDIDAFLAKLNPAGSGLIYSTYLGGNSQDFGLSVQVDSAGNAHLTGRTFSADFPLANPFQAILGGAAGFKTENGGANWSPSTAGLTATVIRVYQIDPANPAIVYAGTDQGMYKSMTAGRNWFPINNGLPADTRVETLHGSATGPLAAETGFAGKPEYVVKLSPKDFYFVVQSRYMFGNVSKEASLATLLFAATGALVYQSADEGRSWTALPRPWSDQAVILSMVAVPGFLGGGASGAELDPSVTAALFVLTTEGVYYRAVIAAISQAWTALNSGLPATAAVLAAGIDGTVYAGSSSASITQVYKLAAGGSAWSLVSRNWSGAPFAPSFTLCLSPDPNNSSRIYAGTNVGAFRSTDGGANWSFLGQQLNYRWVNTIAVDPKNTDIVYAGTELGAYRSSNGGAAWVPVNTGLPGNNVLALAMDPVNTSTLYLGQSRGSDAFVTRVNPAGNGLLYSSFLGGSADDWGLSVALHETNGAYVTGVTESPDFPTVAPFRAAKNGFQDAFVARVVPLNLLNGTPMGSLDAPANNSGVQGTVTIAGWAGVISGKSASIPARLDLLVDGTRIGVLTSGVPRPDVQQYLAGQGVTAPDNLGYSGTWDSRSIADGNHLLSVRAADMAGAVAEALVEIGRVNIITNNGIAPTTTTSASTTSTTSSTSTTTSSTSTIRPTTTTTTTSTTTTLPPVYHRYFPKVTADALWNTGLAVVNLSAETANLTFRAYANAGTLLASAQRTLAPRAQLALQLGELLPAFGQNSGWLLMESSAPSVEGLFLLYDNAVTTMDGAAVSGSLLREFIIAGADEAEISLVNPSAVPVNCTLEYVNDSGAAINSNSSRIPALGRVVVSGAQLRPAGAAGGYLRGSSSGVVPLATFGKAGWLAALPGTDAEGSPESGPRLLYAPQYAHGGGFATVLELVNLEASPTVVTLKLVNDGGTQQGSTASLTLPARGATRIADPSAFGLSSGTAIVQGYVRAESAAGRFAGTVRFTDPAQAQFGSALQFTGKGLTQATFSQVAQNEQYFTGLASLNPNAEPVSVTVTVYDTAGSTVATGTRTIPAGGRFSRVLTELVGALPGISRGYFEVRSSVPVASFALFGTNSGEVLSAIPAQSAGIR